MQYGSLNLNTRYNIIPRMSLRYLCSSKLTTLVVSASYHRRFDAGAWFLVPDIDLDADLHNLLENPWDRPKTQALLENMRVI